MRTSSIKNGLVVGVILLFVGVALSPVITAVDNDKSIDNSDEIGASDDYREIITFIEGSWYTDTELLFGNFYIGSIEMWGYQGENEILGFKRFLGIPFGPLFQEDVVYIKARLFIGVLTPMMQDYEIVRGIAFGNIEWS